MVEDLDSYFYMVIRKSVHRVYMDEVGLLFFREVCPVVKDEIIGTFRIVLQPICNLSPSTAIIQILVLVAVFCSREPSPYKFRCLVDYQSFSEASPLKPNLCSRPRNPPIRRHDNFGSGFLTDLEYSVNTLQVDILFSVEVAVRLSC